jgi:hypothetical protein
MQGYLTEPTPISYDWLNRFVIFSGLGDTSAPATNQVRLFYEGGRFFLKGWDGEWKIINEMTASEILTSLKTVHGTGSGLDADTLDGMQPSPDAGNSTIVQRSSSGYIYCNYLNTTSGNSSNPTHIYGSQDTFIRKVTPQQLVTFLLPATGAGTGLDADLYRGKKIQWGTVGNAKDTGVIVYFPEAFTSIPVIILTPRAELIAWKTDITTTYCRIRAASTTNRTVDWLAIG